MKWLVANLMDIQIEQTSNNVNNNFIIIILRYIQDHGTFNG